MKHRPSTCCRDFQNASEPNRGGGAWSGRGTASKRQIRAASFVSKCFFLRIWFYTVLLVFFQNSVKLGTGPYWLAGAELRSDWWSRTRFYWVFQNSVKLGIGLCWLVGTEGRSDCWSWTRYYWVSQNSVQIVAATNRNEPNGGKEDPRAAVGA